MEGCDIFALVLAILLCIDLIPNAIFDLRYYGWALYLAWIARVENLVVSIFIMIGSCRPFTAGSYRVFMVLLIFSDLIAILNLIVITQKFEFNWPKLIDIFIITPLIICCGFIAKKRANAPIVAPIVGYGTPMVVQNAPYPNNYQPGYIQPSVPVNTYQPPS